MINNNYIQCLNRRKKIKKQLELKIKTGVALADAGYCSEENFTKKPTGDVELLVATQKDYK